jgi:class 3 adenylate cyclase
MERDEAGTFARLRDHRKELIEPVTKKHHGRIFKLMGDSLLAEFASVVDAVALQREMAKRNAGVPDEGRIDIRVGVNLGDVIVVATATINANRTMIWSSPLMARIAAKFSLMLRTTNVRSSGPRRWDSSVPLPRARA